MERCCLSKRKKIDIDINIDGYLQMHLGSKIVLNDLVKEIKAGFLQVIRPHMPIMSIHIGACTFFVVFLRFKQLSYHEEPQNWGKNVTKSIVIQTDLNLEHHF